MTDLRSWRAALLALALFAPAAASADSKDPPMAPEFAPAPSAEPEPRGPRLRLALEAGLGVARGDTDGAALSFDLQLGYQGSDLWAIYYQTGLSVNGWAAEGDSVDTYAFWPQLAMFDLTFGRVFQLGGGLGADLGSFGVCDDNACTMRDSGAQPATEARLALIVPLPGVRARWGIPISLRWHATYFEESTMHTVTLNAGLMRY